MAILSPCVGYCRIDDASGLCAGCARSAAEIGSWKDAPDAVLGRIWAELPGRRERLGIGLHRLGWDAERIRSFVVESLSPGAGTWVLGIFGAVAEFCVGPDEACEMIAEGGRVAALTPRGALRFDLSDRVRALAAPMNVGGMTKEIVVLAVPVGGIDRRAGDGLAVLGPDREAIRPCDREDRLFDLGLGGRAAGFGVRTPDLGLARELEGRAGQRWPELLPGVGARLVATSPHRVVRVPIGRAEVFAPIPLPGDQSPDGPHTHLLPNHLAAGRETPPGLDVPAAFVPCAIFYPQVGPAEADACSGTNPAVSA